MRAEDGLPTRKRSRGRAQPGLSNRLLINIGQKNSENCAIAWLTFSGY